WLGIGIGAFVEKAGLGPWEYARVVVEPSGRVVLFTGGSSVGQGLATAMAQIVADGLGVCPEQVEVVYGDTDRVPAGRGAFASRLTVMGGSAALGAARAVREQALRLAAARLEVVPEDLELAEGVVAVKGSPTRAITLAELDPETGRVAILDYAIAYDVGRAVNPLLVAGQLQGGLAQGVGGALLETLAYDADGQLLTASFMDYPLPTIMEVPEAKLAIVETMPTPLNPLGVKGAGEGGCTGAGGCIANAV